MKRLVFLIVVLLAELLAVVALQGPAGLNPPALLGTVSRVRTWLARPEVTYDKGLSHLGKKEYDDAVNAFTEVIRLKPDYADAYRNRGLAYSRKGESDEGNHVKERTDFNDKALADFNQAIRLLNVVFRAHLDNIADGHNLLHDWLDFSGREARDKRRHQGTPHKGLHCAASPEMRGLPGVIP